jgi:hypothetical protein
MGTKKRKVWVSLYRYGEEGDFLVKTRSDCIRSWWIKEHNFYDWDANEKKKVIAYVPNKQEEVLNDAPYLYKTSWLALLVALGISKKQVLDVLREKLSTTKVKITTEDGQEREEEVINTWLSKKIKFIVE